MKPMQNPNCSCIPDHPYRMLIIGRCGSRKTNPLLNLILTRFIHMLKTYMNQNISYYSKRNDSGVKHLNDLRAIRGYFYQ